MTQIWKFVLQPEVSLSMPTGAEILSVATQGNDICLWARVNPDADREDRTFIGIGTGHDIPNNMNLQFIGTVLLSGGTLVFHIFEKFSLNSIVNS